MTTLEMDARQLSREALHGLRRRTVAAVVVGMSQTQAARHYGVSRKTVGAWVRAYRADGEPALAPRKRGRRSGEQLALSTERQSRIIDVVLSGTPEDAGLRYRLWTRQAIAEWVSRTFEISLSVTTVGNYLVRWDLLPEPRVLRRLRATARVAPGTMRVAWLERAGAGAHLLLAANNQGATSFLATRTPFDGVHVRDFAQRLRGHDARPVRLVICRWPVSQFATLASWAADDPAVVLRH